MPTYKYVCSNGHEFEKFQQMSDEPLKECEVHIALPSGDLSYERPAMKCTALVERVINFEGAISFKGSGWTGKHYS